jgi:tetratricopeptide (TPR) repeat protein
LAWPSVEAAAAPREDRTEKRARGKRPEAKKAGAPAAEESSRLGDEEEGLGTEPEAPAPAARGEEDDLMRAIRAARMEDAPAGETPTPAPTPTPAAMAPDAGHPDAGVHDAAPARPVRLEEPDAGPADAARALSAAEKAAQVAAKSVRVDRTTYQALVASWDGRSSPERAAAATGKLPALLAAFHGMGGGAPRGAQAPELALLLARQSDVLRAAGSPDQAHALAEAAVAMAPSLPATHLAAASARWAREPSLADLVGRVVGAVRAESTDLTNVMRWVFGLSGGLAAAVALLLFLLAAVWALACLRRFAHDAGHRLPARMRGLPGTLLSLALWAAPLGLRAGILPTALWWLTLAWVYLPDRVRVAALVTAVATVLLPPLLGLTGVALTYPESEAHRLHLAQTDLARAPALVRDPSFPSGSVLGMGVKGLVLLRQGKLAEAVEPLEDIIRLDSRNAWARSNLGCVYAGAGQHDRGLREFERVTEMDATDVVALHNAGTVHGLLGRAGAARDAWDAANRLDPALAAALRERSTAGLTPRSHNVSFVDSPAPLRVLLPVALRTTPASEEAAAGLWGLLSPRLAPLPYAALLALVLALWVALWVMRERFRPAAPCARCGVHVCPVCLGARGTDEQCASCRELGSRAVKVEPAARLRKEAEMARHRWRRQGLYRTLSLAVAGLGHVAAGWGLLGALLLFLWGLGVCVAVLVAVVLPDGFAVGASSSGLRVTLALLPALVAYVASWATMFRLGR